MKSSSSTLTSQSKCVTDTAGTAEALTRRTCHGERESRRPPLSLAAPVLFTATPQHRDQDGIASVTHGQRLHVLINPCGNAPQLPHRRVPQAARQREPTEDWRGSARKKLRNCFRTQKAQIERSQVVQVCSTSP